MAAKQGAPLSGGVLRRDRPRRLLDAHRKQKHDWHLLPRRRRVRSGAELAAEKTKAADGIDGRMIRLVIDDDEMRPAAGVEVAFQVIVSHNVDLLICSCSCFSPSSSPLWTQSLSLTRSSEVRTLGGSMVTPFPLEDDVLRAELTQFGWDQGHRAAALVTVNDPYGRAYRVEAGAAWEAPGGGSESTSSPTADCLSTAPRRAARSMPAPMRFCSVPHSGSPGCSSDSVERGWDGSTYKLYPTVMELEEPGDLPAGPGKMMLVCFPILLALRTKKMTWNWTAYCHSHDRGNASQ